MEYVLYHSSSCPFCKHFLRLYRKIVPGADEILLGDKEHLWSELNIDFIPTVIAYENGREKKRLQATYLIGIRKNEFENWLVENNA